jgi:hypothetical protein
VIVFKAAASKNQTFQKVGVRKTSRLFCCSFTDTESSEVLRVLLLVHRDVFLVIILNPVVYRTVNSTIVPCYNLTAAVRFLIVQLMENDHSDF